MTQEPDHWTLDKRIPIAIIATLFLQFGAGVWFAAELRGDVDYAQAQIARHDVEIRELEIAAAAQAVQLGRIESAVFDIRDDISTLVRVLEGSRP